MQQVVLGLFMVARLLAVYPLQLWVMGFTTLNFQVAISFSSLFLLVTVVSLLFLFLSVLLLRITIVTYTQSFFVGDVRLLSLTVVVGGFAAAAPLLLLLSPLLLCALESFFHFYLTIFFPTC